MSKIVRLTADGCFNLTNEIARNYVSDKFRTIPDWNDETLEKANWSFQRTSYDPVTRKREIPEVVTVTIKYWLKLPFMKKGEYYTEVYEVVGDSNAPEYLPETLGEHPFYQASECLRVLANEMPVEEIAWLTMTWGVDDTGAERIKLNLNYKDGRRLYPAFRVFPDQNPKRVR